MKKALISRKNLSLARDLLFADGKILAGRDNLAFVLCLDCRRVEPLDNVKCRLDMKLAERAVRLAAVIVVNAIRHV